VQPWPTNRIRYQHEEPTCVAPRPSSLGDIGLHFPDTILAGMAQQLAISSPRMRILVARKDFRIVNVEFHGDP